MLDARRHPTRTWPILRIVCLCVIGCSGGDGGTDPTPNTTPVATTVLITPPSASVQASGGTVQLTATVIDQKVAVMVGASVTWSNANPTIATVNSTTGLVTGAAAGTATIIATSGAASANALITVTQPPVTSVVMNGTFRIKAGDSYTFTTTQKLADGTVVTRPVTWSVPAGQGSVTSGGVLTPSKAGTFMLTAVIDGTSWDTSVTAYDWTVLPGSTSTFLTLVADVQIANKRGTTDYPDLTISCNTSSGTFFLWVDTHAFVTQSGGVAYYFDQGTISSATWLEFDDFSALGHPGPNLQTKAFASTMAQARRFGFAFTEYAGPAKSTSFRVTGLSALLSPLLASCPRNTAPPAGVGTSFEAFSRANAPVVSEEILAERRIREMLGDIPSSAPTLSIVTAPVEARTALPR